MGIWDDEDEDEGEGAGGGGGGGAGGGNVPAEAWTAEGRPRRIAPSVPYTARLGREIVMRVAAGEALAVICRAPGMPTARSVHRWARERAGPGDFGFELHRAKALAQRNGLGANTSYTEVTAHEICVRVAEGESLSSIAQDPAMPSLGTILHWQRRSEGFARALAMARQARAERMGEDGWEMAMAATPQTAFLTHVRLGHLRWMSGIMSPKTHGRMRAVEPPAPPEPRVERVALLRHFQVERDKATGRVRVVTYIANPATNRPEREHEGEWIEPPTTIASRAGATAGGAAAGGAAVGGAGAGGAADGGAAPIVNKPHDPERWC
jgi:hypothetical protein